MPKYKDLTGQKFGKLLVIKISHTKKRAFWICKCDCGKSRVICSNRLLSNKTTSCGCINPRYNLSVEEAFFKNIQMGSLEECWDWRGYINKKGYGKICFRNKSYQTHRVSYEIFKGAIPVNLLICHECNNPKCVNPNHLYAGTNKDNLEDLRRSREVLKNPKKL